MSFIPHDPRCMCNRCELSRVKNTLVTAKKRIDELVTWKNVHLNNVTDLAATNRLGMTENAEIQRLRDTLRGAARAVESLAFKMPSPNRYTPEFLGIAVSMRNQMRIAKAARTQDPREHYDTDPGGDDRGGG